MIHTGDCLAILPTLQAESVQCCVTSPPYWGLRDYGHEGQMGLESTPAAYVEKMVQVFREVRRVLKPDGTLWLNLGSSYAGSGKGGNPISSPHQKQKTNPGSTGISVSGGKNPNQSPLLWRAPAYGNGGKEFPDSPTADRACRGSGGEPPAGKQSRHAGTVRNDQSAPQAEPLTSQIGHDSERSDSSQATPDASLRAALASTMLQSSGRPQHASFLSTMASACPSTPPTCAPDFQESAHTSAYTSGTSLPPPPLAIRTRGKESFYSACDSPDCLGIGRCGLCWCRLSIPSLLFKAKDEISIPELVALALQADGWYRRGTIIWHKPNPMPESVTDRCTKAHEYLFMLTKAERYYYDHEAIKEPAKYAGLTGQDESGFKDPKQYAGKNGSDKQRGHSRRHAGFNDRWDAMTKAEQCSGMRNKRDVWTIATEPCAEAHFAVMPTALVKPCILAGTRAGDTVLDPFNGSGTVGVVCAKWGRKYIGCELNPEYVAIAERRIAAAKEAAAMPLLEGGTNV